MQRKSQIISLLLTVFFGPFGLLYSSIGMGVVAVILAIFVLIFFTMAAPLFWICTIVAGAANVSSINNNIAREEKEERERERQREIEERRHQELLMMASRR